MLVKIILGAVMTGLLIGSTIYSTIRYLNSVNEIEGIKEQLKIEKNMNL